MLQLRFPETGLSPAMGKYVKLFNMGMKRTRWADLRRIPALRVENAHEAMNELAIAFETIRNRRRAPSAFAVAWAAAQERHDGLLCLRPANRSSIPIRTFDGIFGRYVQRLSESVPRDARGDAACRAAFALCAKMGDSFESELERSDAFNQCVEGVF